MLAVRHLVSAFTKLAPARRPAGGGSHRRRAPDTILPDLPEPLEESAYARAGAEPPLAEVLRDSIVRALMRRDGLGPEEIGRATSTGRPRRR
jgi:hypothetical protein